MAKRSSQQIQQSLLEQYKVWRRGSDQSQPPLEGPPSGGLGGGDVFGLGGRGGAPMQIDIGLGGARGGSQSSAAKPRVQMKPGETQNQAMLRTRREEIAKSRNDQAGAKVWQPGESKPKVWRTPDGKSSSQAPGSGGKSRPPGDKEPQMRADKSSRREIPDQSKIRRQDVLGSTGVHAVAAGLLAGALSRDKETGGAAPDAAEKSVTWIDSNDIVSTTPDNTQDEKKSAEQPIQEPEIRLEPAPPSRMPDVTKPDNEKPVTPTPVPPESEPGTTPDSSGKKPSGGGNGPEPAPTPGSDHGSGTQIDKGYKPGYTGRDVEIKSKYFEEKYRNFLQEENKETAKEKFLQRVIGPESGGRPAIKNPLSPATGLFQFMPKTWAGVVAKAKPGDPHYGVSFEEMPRNVAAQRAAAKQIADEYARTIQRAGLPDIPTSYYLLHGHGPKAVEIYKNPDKQLKDIYPEYVRNKKGEMVKNIVYVQNPNFKPEQRLGDFVAFRAKKMGDKLTDVFPGATAGELPAQPAEKSKPVKPAKPAKADKKTDNTTARLEPIEQKPIGTVVQPDYSKYNVGDLGPLEKIGPGQWRSSKGKIVTDAPELENLPTVTKPESLTDKLKRVAPPFMGGGGELVSQVFGDRKKTAAAPEPVVPPESKKTDPAYEPGTAEYDARMEKLQIAAGDKFGREREARLKAAAKKPADGIELQRDQPGLVKAKRELSDFERAFAAARAEKGPGATFSYTDPRTGKTELKTTAYKGEKPSAKAASTSAIPTAIVPANTGADSVAQSDTSTVQPNQGLDQGEEIVNIPVTKSINRAQDLERIIKQADELVGVPAVRTADELASDELWKDTRSEWNALSQDEQQQRVRDAKLSQAGFDELVQTPELKESINTASHAELRDILRLAGRLK